MIQPRRVWQSSDAADLDLGAEWAEINRANKSDLDLGAEWERELAQMGVVDTGGGTATFEELAAEFLGEDEFSLGVKTGDGEVAQGVVLTEKDWKAAQFLFNRFSQFYLLRKVAIRDHLAILKRYERSFLNNHTMVHVEGFGDTSVEQLYKHINEIKTKLIVTKLQENVEKYFQEISTSSLRKTPTPKNLEEFQKLVEKTEKELTIIDNQCKKLLDPALRKTPSATLTPVQSESGQKVVDEDMIKKRLAYFQEKEKHLFGSSDSIVEKLEKEFSDFQSQISTLEKLFAGNSHVNTVVEFYKELKLEFFKLSEEKGKFQEILNQFLEQIKLKSDTYDITFFETIENILKRLEETETIIDQKVNEIENHLHSVQLFIFSLFSIKKFPFLQDINTQLNLLDLRTQNVSTVNEKLPSDVKTFIDKVIRILEKTTPKNGFFESGVILHTDTISLLDEYLGEIGFTENILKYCDSMTNHQISAKGKFYHISDDLKSIFNTTNSVSKEYTELQETLESLEKGLQGLALSSQKIYLHLKADKLDDIPSPPVFIYAFRDTPSLDALNRIYLEGVGKDVSEESAGAVSMGEATPLTTAEFEKTLNEKRQEFSIMFLSFQKEIRENYERLQTKKKTFQKYIPLKSFPTVTNPQNTVSASQLINFFLKNASPNEISKIRDDVESKYNDTQMDQKKLSEFITLCDKKIALMNRTLKVLALLKDVENEIKSGAAGGAGDGRFAGGVRWSTQSGDGLPIFTRFPQGV